jgi:acid stress chaperone HdeB
MKQTIAALLIFGLTAANNASSIDLSSMTCEEFLASNKDETRIILAWLDGYYKDEQDPPVIDFDTLSASFKKLNEYCAGEPTARLITAADELFGR